jgi:peptidoglycan/LPS O-acetylase OafA/YrhL
VAEPEAVGFDPRKIGGNTFLPVDLKPESFSEEFAKFLPEILHRAAVFTAMRRNYYDERRARITVWVQRTRRILAWAGAAALVLTGLAAALELAFPGLGYTRWPLFAVLVIYAVMGGISFVDRTLDRSTAYFRYVTTILTLRDLSTKLQF